MNQIFLGEPSEYIRNWFIETFHSWPAYTTLKFVDGTTETKTGTTKQALFMNALNELGRNETNELYGY